MDKTLAQFLHYINSVFNMGEKVKMLRSKRTKHIIKRTTIALVLLCCFMLQMPSFNMLNDYIDEGILEKLFPRKTRLPRVDCIRDYLSNIHIETLRSLFTLIVKTIIALKVFVSGTIDGYKVAAIDGIEFYESTKKSCKKCLKRVTKNGKKHYYHRAVVCASVGKNPHIVLGSYMLEPRDGEAKDEGETTGAKKLLKTLNKEFRHFADIIVADALYCKAPFIEEVLSYKMDVVVRVKDERLSIVKNAKKQYESCNADKKWEVKKNANTRIEVFAWDNDNIEMTNLGMKVRFIRFIEVIHNLKKGKKEVREVWVLTTNKTISTETVWKIVHKRWDIENNVFHMLSTEWHFKHCYLHDEEGIGVEAVMLFMLMAFNIMQMFYHRRINPTRRKKRRTLLFTIECLKLYLLSYDGECIGQLDSS